MEPRSLCAAVCATSSASTAACAVHNEHRASRPTPLDRNARFSASIALREAQYGGAAGLGGVILVANKANMTASNVG